MKWYCNIKANLIPGVLNRGYILGRPDPVTEKQPCTVEDMERDGWIGVYDPNVGDIFLNGKRIGGWQAISTNPCAEVDLPKNEPVSDIDNRIKELQNEQKNPKKYRARWTGTRYVYERIEQ